MHKTSENIHAKRVVPSRDQCLELLAQQDTPEHILRHSLVVTEVALVIATRLNLNSCRLDLGVVEAGALLHDIGKMPGLKTGENHAVLGARMLTGIVATPVARIVAEHIYIDASQTEGPLTESLIVNYSDKRVKHDRVVSIRKRFEDLVERYAKSPPEAMMLQGKLDLYLELERTIFSHLSIGPHAPEIMGITI